MRLRNLFKIKRLSLHESFEAHKKGEKMDDISKVRDIKVVTPGDKLMIRISGVAGQEQFVKAQQLITRWLDRGHVLFVGENCEVFILQENSKIELREKINEELEKTKN